MNTLTKKENPIKVYPLKVEDFIIEKMQALEEMHLDECESIHSKDNPNEDCFPYKYSDQMFKALNKLKGTCNLFQFFHEDNPKGDTSEEGLSISDSSDTYSWNNYKNNQKEMLLTVGYEDFKDFEMTDMDVSFTDSSMSSLTFDDVSFDSSISKIESNFLSFPHFHLKEKEEKEL